jgi:hypothetical protein
VSVQFETQPRLSAAGVTTAAILVVILAMGASQLVPSEAARPGDSAGTPSTQVAQAHHQKLVKKS